MDSHIKLRGHHVSRLGAYYNCLYQYNPKKPTLPNGYREHFNLPKRDKVGEKRPNTFHLDWEIVTNPDIYIEIVDGLDTQCLGNDFYLPCLKEKDKTKCINQSLKEDDDACLNEYGLRVGQILKSGELIKIVADYKENTGLDCPRERVNADI